jgi:protocatechuate 3,4-dioxygenase beta subunit
MAHEELSDDRPVGRVLGRRELLAWFGAAGAAALSGCASDPPRETGASPTPLVATPETESTGGPPISADPKAPATTLPSGDVGPVCIVRPEQTAGPFYFDTQLERSDIRVDQATGVQSEGAPLRVTFEVFDAQPNGCVPLPDAIVDIWHCDAKGVYSGVSGDQGSFLRGLQRTNVAGAAEFMTIYPGWYPGRAVHIHFKVLTAADTGSMEFVSQLYFDDALTDTVFEEPPYSARQARSTRNTHDGLFSSGGNDLLLDVTRTSEGYAAVFRIGLIL